MDGSKELWARLLFAGHITPEWTIEGFRKTVRMVLSLSEGSLGASYMQVRPADVIRGELAAASTLDVSSSRERYKPSLWMKHSCTYPCLRLHRGRVGRFGTVPAASLAFYAFSPISWQLTVEWFYVLYEI